MCGEKEQYKATVLPNLGSPPRVRGKVVDHTRAGKHLGITPACAGKRMTAFPQGALLRDHPRVCGEKFYGMTYAQRDAGSPPRVRGKVFLWLFVIGPAGITPACAGKRTCHH